MPLARSTYPTAIIFEEVIGAEHDAMRPQFQGALVVANQISLLAVGSVSPDIVKVPAVLPGQKRLPTHLAMSITAMAWLAGCSKLLWPVKWSCV